MGSISEPEVTLFTIKFSRYAQRVQISLEEKGISCKIIEVESRNKPQLLIESNPIYKKVPTIIHSGKPIAESLVILEYLEEEWPEQVPLMPKDAFERSKVRFWTDYIYKSFSTFDSSWKTVSGSPEWKAAQEATTKALKTLETAMTEYSTEGPFFTGEKFGYLDVVLAPLENTLMLAEKVGGLVIPGPDENPRVHKWIDTVKKRPSFTAAIESKEDTLPFFIGFLKRKAAEAAAAASSQ